VAAGVEHLWTNDDLAAALLHGTRLPGEPVGPPPFPDYLAITYRRQSAAHFLGKRAKRAAECLGPLLFVAAHDEDEGVRLTCLEQLFGSRWAGLEEFMVAMSFDPANEVRRLAIEALGLMEADSQLPVARRLMADSDSEIREKARAMLAYESWERWRL
jgi:HEAT repeat protein